MTHVNHKQHCADWREKNRERLREDNRLRRLALKDEALDRYGRICARCGFSNILALQIDHVNDNGAEERQALGGRGNAGWNFYRWLKKNGWPEGYQTLCANCNTIKQQELLINAPMR